MLKKLRVKLVSLIMGVVTLILAVVFTAICLLDYQQDIADVESALQSSLVHADGFARDHYGFEGAEPRAMPPEIGGRRDKGPLIPVAVYAVLPDETAEAVPTRMTASLSEETLSQAVRETTDQPDGFGHLSALGLYFEKRTAGDVSFIAFADGSAANGWRQLALMLAGAALLLLGAVFVVSLLFSRWALRPVEEAWQRQRQFVSDASHDLRTPITVILANNSILLDHQDQSVESQRQWVQSTQHEALQMQGLVEDLLLLAKMDESAASGQDGAGALAEDVDLSTLVEGELLQFESIAFDRGVGIEESVEEGILVKGDRARLARLVSTLVDNACKYAEPSSSIAVSLAAKGRTAQLAVRNDGQIAQEDLPHLFDRFYRADKARTGSEGGHGLGLAIAQAIAREHGGSIEVASSADAGTTFTVQLPFDQAVR